MGSGKLISRAIKKYGYNNFEKTILFIFETEDEMNRKEADIVTQDFCSRSDTYNICPGGKGGWGYVNETPEMIEKRDRKEYKVAGAIAKNKAYPRRKFSRKELGLPRKKNAGQLNSQYGTMWITDGKESRKIRRVDIIPDGWYPGRKMKNSLELS